MINIGLKLKTTKTQFRSAVETALAFEIVNKTRRIRNFIELRVGQAIIDIVSKDPIWSSIVSGSLRADLGIPLNYDLNKVLETIANTVEVFIDVKSVKASKIKITIRAIPENFNDVLALTEAEYVSRPSGSTIPWLRWLLFEGSAVLVDDYVVNRNLTGREAQRSRTHIALMKKQPGATFRMQPAAAGNPTNNFISRALIRGKIDLIVARIVEEAYNR